MNATQVPPFPVSNPSAYDGPDASADDGARNTAFLAHLSTLTWLVGLPFGNLIGPLIVWWSHRGKSDFVDAHCRAVINFQITITVAGLAMVGVGIAAAAAEEPIGFVALVPLVLILALVLVAGTVVGCIRARAGELYRYPLALPWI